MLHDVAWQLQPHEHWLVTGANGSGKSTFLRVLHGQLRPALGGSVFLSGFRSGRLRDRSSFAVMARYSWPVWMWLRGSLQGGVGNVFGERFSGFDPQLFRGSLAMGFEGYTSQDSVLEALVGFGTETFKSGADLNTARIIVGARRGF